MVVVTGVVVVVEVLVVVDVVVVPVVFGPSLVVDIVSGNVVVNVVLSVVEIVESLLIGVWLSKADPDMEAKIIDPTMINPAIANDFRFCRLLVISTKPAELSMSTGFTVVCSMAPRIR